MSADDLILLTKSLRELGVSEFSSGDFAVKFRSDVVPARAIPIPSQKDQVEADRDRKAKAQSEADDELALTFASAGR